MIQLIDKVYGSTLEDKNAFQHCVGGLGDEIRTDKAQLQISR
jgi:hypothetical protein